MMRNKFITGIIALAASLALAAPAAAQDFGFGEPPADGEGVPASDAGGLGFSGSLAGSLRSLVNTDDPAASGFESRTEASLDMKASLAGAEGFFALRLDPATLLEDPAAIVDQAYAAIFSGPLSIKAGLIKVTWGKGDDVHVLDVVNAFDYGDFINRPYAARKIAGAGMQMDFSTSGSGKLELVYLPVFGADRIPTSGPWAMKRVTDMSSSMHDQIYAQTYGGVVSQAVASARLNAYYSGYNGYLASFPGDFPGATAAGYAAGATIVSLANVEAAAPGTTAGLQAQAERMTADTLADLIVQPDGNRLDMGQAGLRFTETIGSLDYGLQYWYGFLREPVYNADPAAVAAAGNHVLLDYNRAHRFGADFAFALGSFNFRGELAYDMTDDQAGDKPLVRNPALGWSAGADAEFLGFRLNVQNLGRYTLFTDGITDAYDVEAGMEALSNTIIADLSRSMLEDRLVLRASGAYSAENGDFAIMPAVEWSPTDNAALRLKGTLFGGDSGGIYGQFKDNSFVEASLTVSF